MALRETARVTQHRANTLVTAPTLEPVSLQEMKGHLRIAEDVIDEDFFLVRTIEEARQMLEQMTGLALVDQTWKLTLDRWPRANEMWWDGVRDGHIDTIYSGNDFRHVYFPRYPINSVDSVTAYDESGTSSAITVATFFDVDTQSRPGRMTLKFGKTWPVALQANNAIEIAYGAGWATPQLVPATLRLAVKQLAAFLYQHRGDCSPEEAFSKSGAKSTSKSYSLRGL